MWRIVLLVCLLDLSQLGQQSTFVLARPPGPHARRCTAFMRSIGRCTGGQQSTVVLAKPPGPQARRCTAFMRSIGRCTGGRGSSSGGPGKLGSGLSKLIGGTAGSLRSVFSGLFGKRQGAQRGKKNVTPVQNMDPSVFGKQSGASNQELHQQGVLNAGNMKVIKPKKTKGGVKKKKRGGPKGRGGGARGGRGGARGRGGAKGGGGGQMGGQDMGTPGGKIPPRLAKKERKMMGQIQLQGQGQGMESGTPRKELKKAKKGLKKEIRKETGGKVKGIVAASPKDVAVGPVDQSVVPPQVQKPVKPDTVVGPKSIEIAGLGIIDLSGGWDSDSGIAQLEVKK